MWFRMELTIGHSLANESNLCGWICNIKGRQAIKIMDYISWMVFPEIQFQIFNWIYLFVILFTLLHPDQLLYYLIIYNLC